MKPSTGHHSSSCRTTTLRWRRGCCGGACRPVPIIAFWHIPWPDSRVFRTCPWRRELLDGLLGSDIVGFQTPEDCVNFLETVEQTLGGCIDYEQNAVSFRGRTTRARVYPVGVEWNNPHVRALPSSRVCRARVCRELGLPPDVRLGVGVDRLDYTKGINEKFLAVERLLECQPELRGRFVFVQVAEPSRACLPAYRTARNQLATTAERVNVRFGSGSHRPILLLERHHEPADVFRLYRAADFCYVGSLHDGMNLVAKEFVSARADERGVLVLSRFAGSVHQLRGALTINPYLVEESATALSTALAMPDPEQADRMRRMRQIVETFDTYWWADQMLQDARPVRWAGEPLPSQSHAPVHRMSA